MSLTSRGSCPCSGGSYRRRADAAFLNRSSRRSGIFEESPERRQRQFETLSAGTLPPHPEFESQGKRDLERAFGALLSPGYHRHPESGREERRHRRRHPATVQTPGRRVPSEDEARMEPITHFFEPMSDRDYVSEFPDPLVPERLSDDDYDYEYEDENVDEFIDEFVVGELELSEEEEEEDRGTTEGQDPPYYQSSVSGGVSDYRTPLNLRSGGGGGGSRIRTFSDAAPVDDSSSRPAKKLSHSLNAETPLITLLS